MRVTLLLCDAADGGAFAGKLHTLGIGWNRLASDTPTFTALAVLINVPYRETNRKHDVLIRLVTEGGEPYPSDKPAQFEFQFDVGKPPGLLPDDEQIVPFVARVSGAVFVQGVYRWEALIDNELVAVESFRALPQLPMALPSPIQPGQLAVFDVRTSTDEPQR